MGKPTLSVSGPDDSFSRDRRDMREFLEPGLVALGHLDFLVF